VVAPLGNLVYAFFACVYESMNGSYFVFTYNHLYMYGWPYNQLL